MRKSRTNSCRTGLALALSTAAFACATGEGGDDEVGFDTFVTYGGEDDEASAGDESTSSDAESSANGDGDPSDDSSSETTTDDGDSTTGGGADDREDEPVDCEDIGGDCCPPNPNADAILSGTVWAPNGVIPVSGALVYTSAEPPEPIPNHVYCAECLELVCGLQDYTVTDQGGTFSVQATSGDKYLVVQKGQFMRVMEIAVEPGNTVLLAEQTELPSEWNPGEGLYIPKIAIGHGTYDRLEDAFGKLGLGETMIAAHEQKLVPGTEQFELWDNGGDPVGKGFVSQGSLAQLVSDPAALARYHAIFVPCSTDDLVAVLDDPQVIANIRGWVEAGGRWYVADWANEWLAKPFPEYQKFYVENGGNDLESYDSLAKVLDDGLLDWLEAMPGPLVDINPLNDESHPTLSDLPNLLTVDNWSGVRYPLPEVVVDDGMGNRVDVGHKVWLEGPGGGDVPDDDIHPLTITAQYGCGKIQFTSYHTAEFFDYVGLSPQELVLMYTILEIGVCQADLPPPV